MTAMDTWTKTLPDKPGLWMFRHPEYPGWVYEYKCALNGSIAFYRTFPPEKPVGPPPPRTAGGEWCLLEQAS